jgi:hypothetical protein
MRDDMDQIVFVPPEENTYAWTYLEMASHALQRVVWIWNIIDTALTIVVSGV